MIKMFGKLAAALAAVALVAGPQAAGAQVIAQIKGERAPFTLIAITAFGDNAALTALEKAAAAKGLRSGRVKNNGVENEVMVFLHDQGDPNLAWPLFNDAVAGKFGKLEVKGIVVPRNLDPGAEDYLDSARVYSAAAVSPAPRVADVMAGTKDHPVPMVVLGLIADGSEADMAKVEAAGSKAGFKTARSKSDTGKPDVMVILPDGMGDAGKFWALWRAAATGKLGSLKLQLITVPTNFDPDMDKYLDFARVYAADQVIVP